MCVCRVSAEYCERMIFYERQTEEKKQKKKKYIYINQLKYNYIIKLNVLVPSDSILLHLYIHHNLSTVYIYNYYIEQ